MHPSPKRPRLLTSLALLCAVLATGLLPNAVIARPEIARLWTGFREARSFVRLSELFTGKENPGKRVILRSQPGERTGFYYIVRLVDRDRHPVPDGTVVLHVIPPDGDEPHVYRFPFKGDGRHKLRLDVGLTGKDWPYDREQLPLAWKIEILDATGALIDSRESFLWSRPRDSTPDTGDN